MSNYYEDFKKNNILVDEEYKDNAHASYYGGKDNPYEAVKVINAWSKKNKWNGEQGFTYGTVLRYISRAGQKKDNSEAQDIQKCINYLQMRLDNILLNIKDVDDESLAYTE